MPSLLRSLVLITLLSFGATASAQTSFDWSPVEAYGDSRTSGQVVPPPIVAVSPSELVFVLGSGGMVAEQELTLSNEAEEGAATLLYTAFTRKSGGDGLLHQAAGEETLLTQSLSQDIVNGYASICSPTSTTSYWRLFDLSDTDLEGEFAMTSVEIGIAAAPVIETTLRLYRLDGDSFRFGTLTLLDEVSVPLEEVTEPVLLSVAVSATIATDAKLAVEWNTPVIPDEGPFFGSNLAGETRPHYRSYPGCFSTELPPIASPSGHVNWVLNVRGNAGPPPFVVSPGQGVISAGTSEALTVAVDATAMPEGVHPYEVIILTNDPEAPSLSVPVSVVVEAAAVSTEGTPATGRVTLDAAYPNPFRNVTMLSFDLAEAERVIVEVYDMLGRRIDTLLERELFPGTHAIEWSAMDLTAGLYLIRLQAGPEVHSTRVTVVR